MFKKKNLYFFKGYLQRTWLSIEPKLEKLRDRKVVQTILHKIKFFLRLVEKKYFEDLDDDRNYLNPVLNEVLCIYY